VTAIKASRAAGDADVDGLCVAIVGSVDDHANDIVGIFGFVKLEEGRPGRRRNVRSG
jgi:hypothetical protein